MTEKIQFYPIDIESVAVNNKDYVRMFGRTSDNRKICVYERFDDYFWVIPERENVEWVKRQIENIKIKEAEGIFFVKRTELHIKKFLGKSVKAIKVILNNSKDMQSISEEVKKISGYGSRKELDVPLYKKYLIDNKITPLTLCEVYGENIDSGFEVDICVAGKVTQIGDEVLKNPKVLGFDIEIADPYCATSGETNTPIAMIGFSGSDGFAKCILWKEFENPAKDIEFVKDEKELLLRFAEIIRWYKPDYIVGYYSDGFDWPFIKARADINKVNIDIGTDKSRINFNKKAGGSVRVKGIPHIDVFKFVKNIMSGDVASGSLQTQSYSLDSVAKEILNDGKIPVDILKLKEALERGGKELENYCYYNLKDAELCLKIFEKILPNLNELVKIISAPIYDVSKMTFGQLIENYLIKETRNFNEIIPGRPTYNEKSDRNYNTYTGGFVYEPKPGLYEDLAVFDFRGLHPSIISAHNICLSTLSKDSENAIETPEIEGRKYYFSYKEEGFIPQIIRELIQRRIRIKQIIKDSEKKDPVLGARSYALKILAAGFHGYMGYAGARWYSVACAEGILAYARDYVKKLIAKCIEFGFNVIYSDTDSCFVELNGKTKQDAEKFLKEFNKDLPSLMELELENFYKRGIFVSKKSEEKGAKKKYALIDEKENIKIRGFETVRRDWSDIAKESQNRVIEILLKEGDKKKAVDCVREVIRDIKEKKIDVKMMKMGTQLRRDIDSYESIGPHVAVARKLRARGINVGVGSIINYVISDLSGSISEKAVLFEDSVNYDSEYYIHNQIIPAVEKILEVFGYRKEDLISGEQTKLGEF